MQEIEADPVVYNRLLWLNDLLQGHRESRWTLGDSEGGLCPFGLLEIRFGVFRRDSFDHLQFPSEKARNAVEVWSLAHGGWSHVNPIMMISYLVANQTSHREVAAILARKWHLEINHQITLVS